MSGEARRMVATELELQISQLPHGQRLPSEQQLMRIHGVGRSAIRAALDDLAERHLVRRVPGVGTFVHRRITYTISPRCAPSFSATVGQAGSESSTVVLHSDLVAADPGVARALRLPEGSPVRHMRRLGHIDETPACLFDEWFAPCVLTELDLAVRTYGSVTEVLRSSGFAPARQLSRGTVTIAPRAVCEHLQVPEGTQTWFVESTNVDAPSGAPLMHSRAFTRTDLVRMVFEVVAEEDLQR